jgi:hypothetical protein
MNVAVFESDMGNPDYVLGILQALMTVAMVVAAVTFSTFTPGLWTISAAAAAAAAAFALAALAYDLVSGGEDDLVSTETVSLAASQIQVYADEEPSFKKGEIPYHFSTIHRGGGFDLANPLDGPAGADYHIYFTIRRVPPPPVVN